MRLTFPSLEFDDAVAAVCHGSASNAEMHALNDLLRSNSGAQDEYLWRVELHTRLASAQDLYAHFEAVPAACLTPATLPERFNNSTPSGSALTPSRSRLSPALVVTACLLLTAIGGWVLWSYWLPARKGGTTSAVAMLVRAVDAHWGKNTAPVRVGSALSPGWLRLESGLAQVVFYSGARLVIEGPAELQLVSRMEAFCSTGRLLAEVPQPARGFRLRTNHLKLKDLGTAFGVDATHGRTEVHVFKGEVELLPGTAAKHSLAEGEAVAVKDDAPLRLMPASASAFTSLFDFQERSLASEAFRYEQWQLANARHNLDPSLVVHLEFQDLNTSDWMLRNSAQVNRSVPDATIVGCQRAEGRWREKQALEFQSVNDRVRLAIPGQFQSLTLSAWVCVKGLDRKLNSLFMCDEFEPGTVHWLIRNDGVVGLTVFGRQPGKFQILVTPPVVRLDKLGMWTHLAVVVDGKARRLVHYVNGSPVSREALKFGPPFRLGAAELGNWNARSGSNPALIRNFSGALDEFELFSRALNEAEIRELYAKGKPGL